MLRALPVLSMLLALACGGAETPANDSPPRGAAESATPTSSPAGAETAEQSEAPPPVDPAPAPTLEVLVEAEGEAATLRVRNRGEAVARVRTALKVEAREGEGWAPVEASLALRDDCEAAPPACRDLAPGAELEPPAWASGDAQCGCEGCVPLEGELRVVVESCEPEGHLPHRVASAPVRL